MDEKRRAERFNRELDALLAGKGPAPELPEAARRLGEADFSKESRIRESLRRRLLERRSPAEGLFGGWLPRIPVPAAAAAALLVLVAAFPLRQLVRRVPPATPVAPQPVSPSTAVRPEKPRAPVGSYAPGAAGSGTVPAEPEGLEDSELWRKPITAEDLIERVSAKDLMQSRPADGLIERRAAEGLLGTVSGSPMSPVPAQPVFSTVKGRKVTRQDRVQIVWETGDSVYILERRATSLEEIFERTAL